MQFRSEVRRLADYKRHGFGLGLRTCFVVNVGRSLVQHFVRDLMYERGNSSAGCIPDRSVDFPAMARGPSQEQFLGEVKLDALRFHELEQASGTAHVAIDFVSVGNSLPSV